MLLHLRENVAELARLAEGTRPYSSCKEIPRLTKESRGRVENEENVPLSGLSCKSREAEPAVSIAVSAAAAISKKTTDGARIATENDLSAQEARALQIQTDRACVDLSLENKCLLVKLLCTFSIG